MGLKNRLQTRAPARQVARFRNDVDVWIDHAALADADLEWLAQVEKLTLWNVAMPAGFLASLSRLWWLDIRGGSAGKLDQPIGCGSLRYLCVNQVRGMRDLSAVAELSSLEYLQLYGLPQVACLPELATLTNLKRASIGQMAGLRSLSGLLAAPNLSELLLVRNVSVNATDVELLCNHSALSKFSWHAEDAVAIRIWEPIVNRVGLPEALSMHVGEWFASQA